MGVLNLLCATKPSPASGRGWRADLEVGRLPGEGVNQKALTQFHIHPHPRPLSRQRERGAVAPLGCNQAAKEKAS